MKLLISTLLAIIAAGVFAQQTIYNSVDINVGVAPGGTSCGHSNTYDFTGNSRGPFYVGIPLNTLSGPVSSAQFYIKPTRCVNADRLGVFVRTVVDASAQIQEQYSTGNCPFLELADPSVDAQIDNNCESRPVDVTAAVNAALAAGNNQLVLNIFNGRRAPAPGVTDDIELNWCNPFINPGVEPKYSEQSNCGLLIRSREYEQSSFYIVVNGGASTAAPSTAAPTTAAPTTASPTTEATCAPCPCGSVAGKRRSGCPVCIECTTTTTTEPPVQATTCAPCPCGSHAGKRRSGCPVCLECTTTAAPTTTEPPVQATTCEPCPCGSITGKRRNGCPVCVACTTTAAPTTSEPPVQATCPPCPCGSHAGKRRSGCPVCLECTTTKAPTTSEPPVQTPSTSSPPSSTAQISGDNNARANSGIRTFVAGSAVVVAAVAAML